jgi:hypothetical protein
LYSGRKRALEGTREKWGRSPSRRAVKTRRNSVKQSRGCRSSKKLWTRSVVLQLQYNKDRPTSRACGGRLLGFCSKRMFSAPSASHESCQRYLPPLALAPAALAGPLSVLRAISTTIIHPNPKRPFHSWEGTLFPLAPPSPPICPTSSCIFCASAVHRYLALQFEARPAARFSKSLS